MLANVRGFRVCCLICLFIIFGLRWVFVAAGGLSLVAASGGYALLQCAGFSSWRLLLLQSTGSRCVGFSSCGALVALQHVGSSRTRGRTRVPCTGRQILNHCATREARLITFNSLFFILVVALKDRLANYGLFQQRQATSSQLPAFVRLWAKTGFYIFKRLEENQKKNNISLQVKIIWNPNCRLHKVSSVGIQPCPFIYVSPMAAFASWQESWVGEKETMSSTKLELFIRPFTEKFADCCFRAYSVPL